MSDIYTIETVDHTSGPANAIAASLRNVARAQIRANEAFKAGDFAQQKLMRSAEAAARSELRAARAGATLQTKKQPGFFGNVAKGVKSRSGLGIGGVALGGIIAGAALSGIRAAVDGVMALGSAVLETAKHIGSTRAALTGMLGSQKAADEEIASGTKLAKQYGLGIAETLDQMRQFAAFGFGKEQRNALTLLAGDMKALGMNAEQVNRSMSQIGQIQTKGKLQGEELIVLAENGINIDRVYANLGRRLGKTRDQIIAMQKAGKLKSGDALNAIAESIVQTGGSKNLGESGLKAAETTAGGATGRIGALWEDAFRTAVQRAEPDLVRGLNSIAKGLGASEGEGIAGALTSAIKGIGSALEQIGPKLPGWIASIDRMAQAIEGIIRRWDQISGVFSKTNDAAGAAAKQAMPGAGVASAGFDFVGNLLGGDSIGEAIKNTFLAQTPFGDLQKAGAAAGEQMAAGMAMGIQASAGLPAAAAAQMTTDTIGASRDAAGIHSPSKVMADNVGYEMDAGLARGLEEDQQLAFSAAKELADGTIMAAESALAAPAGGGLVRDGERAGASSSKSSSARSVSVTIAPGAVTIQLSGAAADALPSLKGYLETDFIAMLERHLEGVGA